MRFEPCCAHWSLSAQNPDLLRGIVQFWGRLEFEENSGAIAPRITRCLVRPPDETSGLGPNTPKRGCAKERLDDPAFFSFFS